MANITLHQALTTEQTKALTIKDLDNSINYLWKITLEEYHDYPTWFIRYGMPVKFPNGKYGFVVVGNSGLHTRPDPDPLDHRVSFRYGEIPFHHIEFGEITRVIAPMTIYKDKNFVELERPEVYWAMMLKALSLSLPHYIKYLSYSIFKGKTKKRELMDDYMTTFIEPKDGNTNGYKFYLSEGYGDINLKKVIAKAKVTQHKLQGQLKKINDELTKDSKKVETDFATSTFKDKKWVKDNLNDESKKFISVLLKCQEEIDKVLLDGFDKKYRVDQTKFEGFKKPVKPADLVLMLPRASWRKLQQDIIYATPGSDRFTLDSFGGVQVILDENLDDNTAYIIERDLIQFWVIPELIKNRIEPYGEGTVDYITEFAHSTDLIGLYHNIYIKHK